MTMPTVHGFGALSTGTGSVAPVYPASIAANDVALLFCCTLNAEAIPAVDGYDSVLALDNTASRLTILKRTLLGNETAPTVGDPGNYIVAGIGVFRGVDPANPIHAHAFASLPAATSVPTYPGLDTSIDDCMIVFASAWGADSAGPMSSGFTNASISNGAERYDGGTTDGSGGGLIVITAEKATAGQVDISSCTLAVSQTIPAACIALRPARDQSITGTVTLDGVAVANASNVVTIVDVTSQDYVVSASIAGGAGSFAALVRSASRSYVAFYDDGAGTRGSSAAAVAATAHDISIFTDSTALVIEAPGDPYLTVAAIRDRVVTIIEALSPRLLASDRFIESRQEYAGDIRKWALANPQSCLRRLSVRNIAEDETPLISQQDVEQRRMVLEIVLCYPQTHRYGEQAALDRDDAIESDFFQIDYAVGIIGRANFAAGSAHDCTPMPNEKEIERDEGGVDFLVIRQPYLFYVER